MLTRERLSLLLATIVVVGLLAFLFVTLPFSGGDASAAQPITKVLLRRHDRRKAPLSPGELKVLRGQEPTTMKRDLEDTTPKHVPIKIKIKAEKEKAFQDMGNGEWLRDMEIEVKNTGHKPIYFLSLIVDLPEVKEADKAMGWEVHFGRGALASLEEPLKPQDIPINPGETHTFTLADRFVKGWERAAREDHLPTPKRVRVLFQFMNFGDGTGLDTTSAVPASKQTPVAEAVRPKSIESKTPIQWPLIAYYRTEASKSSDNLPALGLANFLGARRSNSFTVEANTSLDLCCPGTSCTWAKRAYTRCQCSPIEDTEIQDAPTIEFPGCSQTGACYSLGWEWHWCEFPNTDGTKIKLSCSIPVFHSCGTDPTATPSPSPSVEPSCDPTTRPNSTNCSCVQGPNAGEGFWGCWCPSGNKPADYNQFPGTLSHAGCDPYTSYNNGGDCCVCAQPLCPDGTDRNMATCYCPSPSPTPTPDNGGSGGEGGGGGGGGDGYPLLEKDTCVDFYFVHFVSHDGGHTWYYDDREVYAGCYYID